jgi:hypothetical protein
MESSWTALDEPSRVQELPDTTEPASRTGSMLSGWVLGFDAGCLAGSLDNWPARLRCVFLRWWALIGRLDRSSSMVGTNCAVRRAEKSE